MKPQRVDRLCYQALMKANPNGQGAMGGVVGMGMEKERENGIANANAKGIANATTPLTTISPALSKQKSLLSSTSSSSASSLPPSRPSLIPQASSSVPVSRLSALVDQQLHGAIRRKYCTAEENPALRRIPFEQKYGYCMDVSVKKWESGRGWRRLSQAEGEEEWS